MRPQRVLMSLVACLLMAGSAGCDSPREECDQLCRSFIQTCEWNAWGYVSQCTQGCVEDMYRRDDADEIFACYRAAVSAPTREEAAQTVQLALDAGLFSKDVAVGLFNLEEAIDAAVENGTCDPFAAVQCKVEALKAPPSGLFIQP